MTWLLRGLALVLAIGAVVAAFIGYRLSTQPAPAQPAARPAETAVHAAKPLRAGEVIAAADVAAKPVAARPSGSFAAPAEVIGQAPAVDIAPGEVLQRSHFQANATLTRALRPDERAVAIKVDEVAGLGGFALPGNHVDVLLYLRGSQETGNATTAQVVLTDVRVLAYGEAVQQAPAEDNAVARGAEKLAGRPRTHTSAILAVPAAAASRLMLAANSGTLRLSLRPATVPAQAADPSNLIRLGELTHATRPDVAKPVTKAAAPAIVIHEGTAVRAVGVPTH
jgi:pilus assembly protein CpaB